MYVSAHDIGTISVFISGSEFGTGSESSQAQSSALVVSVPTATSDGGDRADEDFDGVVRQMWDEHLRSLDATTAASKKWKCWYWYRVLIVEADECELVVDREPSICEPLGSNVDLPSCADMTGVRALQNIKNNSRADSQSRNHRRHIFRESYARRAGGVSFSTDGIMETRARRLSISHH